MPAILIDTNLLLYSLDQTSPGKQDRAQRALEALARSGTGRLSVQSLAEFASAATRKLSPPLAHQKVMEQIQLFQELWQVFILTPAIVLEAVRAVEEYQLSYYDAQIWAAARMNQVPYIFSEDFQDGVSLEGVKFVNPFSDHFKLEEWIS
jgi:predicted nucleic acid-binding protein